MAHQKLNDRLLSGLSTTLEGMARLISRHKWKTIFAYLAITGFFFAGMSQFKLNQSMEAFFLKEDPTMAKYRWFKFVYGSDEFLMVMYQPKEGDVFSPASLQRVKNLEDRLNEERVKKDSPLSRIAKVRSIVSADYLESKNDQLINRAFIGDLLPQSEAEVAAIRKLAQEHRDYPGSYFSKDSAYGVIMIETDYGARVAEKETGSAETPVEESSGGEFDFGDEESTVAAKTIAIADVPKMEEVPMNGYTVFITELKKIFAEADWAENNETHFAGNPWIMTFFDQVIMKEIGMYAGLSILIIWLVLTFAFRSLTALVWPTLILVSGIIWTMGFIGWTGIEMTFMINIIVFLLLAVSIASSIHVLSGFGLFRSEGDTPVDALAKTYEKAGVPIILAGITTAVGLVALIFVPILAIRNFGMFGAVGVLFTLTLNLFMWPALLALWAPKVKEREQSEGSFLNKFLSMQKDKILEHKGKIYFSFAAITLIALAGIPKVKIDTNFVEMIKSGHGITESYGIIDEHFGGTASIEVLVNTGVPDGVKNPKVLKAMDSFIEDVKDTYPMAVRARSLVSATKESHQRLMNNTEQDYRIPDSKEAVAQVLISFASADPSTRKMFVDDAWQVARISFSVLTKGTYEYADFIEGVTAKSATHFADARVDLPQLSVNYSGGVDLMVKLITLVSTSQLRSFSLAIGVICLLIFFLFGSVRFGILAMIPNIFPLIILAGVMGWAGVNLDSDTLLCIPIAIGIAVDDTIHFLTHYRSEIIAGHSPEKAVEESLRKVGRAMTFTTVVLSTGFFVFVLSAYIPLNNFGFLSAIAITSALFGDLFLLPLLLLMFGKSRKERKMPAMVTASAGVLLISVGLLASNSADASTDAKAKEIAGKVFDRDEGKSSMSVATLLSCDFKETNGKRSCTSGKRKKVFESISLDMDDKGEHRKSLSLIKEPSEEKGVAFLQEDFDEQGKDSLQWMYLPALKKLKRIVSASENEPKTGTLFGSEVAYEDIEKMHLEEFTYKYQSESEEDGRKVWVIEVTPTAKRSAKSSYSKSIMHVDQETYIPLKSESYDKQGRLAKTFFSRDIKKISGIWMSTMQIIVNHKSSRMSMMKMSDIKVNVEIDQEVMSPRALSDADFRKQKLDKIKGS